MCHIAIVQQQRKFRIEDIPKGKTKHYPNQQLLICEFTCILTVHFMFRDNMQSDTIKF